MTEQSSAGPLSPRPPDVTRDRFYAVIGGTAFLRSEQDAHVSLGERQTYKVPLVEVEEAPGRPPGVMAAPRSVEVVMELWVGTVDEMCARFRQHLLQTFERLAADAPLMLGENSLESLQRLLARNGVTTWPRAG